MKICFLSLSILAVTFSGASAAVMNIAPSGTASSSSTDFGGLPALANDGNRDGNFGAGSVFHSAGGTGPGEWYEVNLGGDRYIDRVLVFPRTDQRQFSVRDFSIEIFNSGGGSVYTGNFLETANTNDDPWGTSAMSGVLGQRVRLTLDNPNNSTVNFLTFSEMEIWGDTTPVPVNLAPTATITSSTADFDTFAADGVDGDLASQYNAITGGSRPIFHDNPAAGQGFYKLAFGTDIYFDEVQLYNRINNNAVVTTTGYRVSILDAADATVTSQLVTADGTNYDHILNFSGFTGRSVLVEESSPGQFLAFSEVRVFGSPIPEPSTALLSLLGGLILFRRKRR